MGGGYDAKTVFRWTALAALFAIPLTPLIVTGSLYFPFITGKALFFRTLAEIAFVSWLALALLDRTYRPRFSWIGVSALAFVVWMFVADLSAMNATKAFWSNFERMEGWVLLAHLFGFFLAASSILRAEQKWRAWFLASLGVSVVVCAYALLQMAGVFVIHQGSTRIDASFGNSAYLAIYLLFTVFIAGWLALSEERLWLKRALFSLAALAALLIFFTSTRGTVIGLAAGLGIVAFATVRQGEARVRRFAAVGIGSVVLLSGVLWLARDTSFVEQHEVLHRIASISLQDGSTRFAIWGMAYQGFLKNPVLGWGQEGFNYVFQKYYDPGLYRQEPWFDRAHNAFLDWLTAGGLPAFFLYLSLFGLAFWCLWRGSGLSSAERVALSAALLGYGVHNLFVFDNLYSYVYFFAILACIDSQVGRPVARIEEVPEAQAYAGVVGPVALVAAVALVWVINVPALRAASGLISALSSPQDVQSALAAFSGLVQGPAFSRQEAREQLVSYELAVVQSQAIDTDQKIAIATLAINEMAAQVAAYPQDARERIQLAYAYRAIGDSTNALAALKDAGELSPKKQSIFIDKGAIEWDRGNLSAALDYFKQAHALSPQFAELSYYVAAGYYVSGDPAAADALLKKTAGTTVVDNDVLALAYVQTKDWPRLIRLWEKRANAPGASVETKFGLAGAYYMSGDTVAAIRQIRAVMAAHPDVRAAGEAAIKQIEAGK